jgi:hypothetical protein
MDKLVSCISELRSIKKGNGFEFKYILDAPLLSQRSPHLDGEGPHASVSTQVNSTNLTLVPFVSDNHFAGTVALTCHKAHGLVVQPHQSLIQPHRHSDLDYLWTFGCPTNR